jgi:branched-chain amino acid transport system ATP-binding protein
MLEVKEITAAYQRGYDILHGVELTVSADETVCLIGPNGSGKSTVLKSIMGLVTVGEGVITLEEKNITNTPPHRVLRIGIAYVPQGRKVFPGMTVWENLRMGGFILKDKEDLERRIREIYELFPILDKYKEKKAYMLSGGEQQMISIGRALLLDPSYMLVDEPSLGLSPKVMNMVFDTLNEIKRKGMGLLIVEQNAVKGLELADRGYALDLGRIRFTGPADQLLNDEEVRALYLGK